MHDQLETVEMIKQFRGEVALEDVVICVAIGVVPKLRSKVFEVFCFSSIVLFFVELENFQLHDFKTFFYEHSFKWKYPFEFCFLENSTVKYKTSLQLFSYTIYYKYINLVLSEVDMVYLKLLILYSLFSNTCRIPFLFLVFQNYSKLIFKSNYCLPPFRSRGLYLCCWHFLEMLRFWWKSTKTQAVALKRWKTVATLKF